MREQEQGGLNREVFSVAELNRNVRRLLEGEFPMVWVEGEISNFARPRSGHWYFTLKDEAAQLRCAMFKNRNQLLRFTPKDGNQVIVRGRISLYEGRGEFQLIAEHIEDAGDGALRRAYDALKAKLQKEGLFDAERKKPVPELPRHVAIITSPTGAAIRDVLSVMARRFPAIEISILPVQVQGEGSVEQIIAQIEFANTYAEDSDDNPIDLLLLTRGGGSLEDLWSFNSETVARAVVASELPLVCAVGHESDVSIADFVADLRAPTPSAAAELISPDVEDWLDTSRALERRLVNQFASLVNQLQSNLGHLSKRLQHPGRRLQDLQQRLDELELRLKNSLDRQLEQLGHSAFDDAEQRLGALMMQHLERRRTQLQLTATALPSPLPAIQQAGQRSQFLLEKLKAAMDNTQDRDTSALHGLMQKLDALSPLATLDRGYAIVSNDADQIITRAEDVAVGEMVNIRLQRGQIAAEVRETRHETDD